MVKRKIWLILGVLVMVFVFSPKNAYAGTCKCAPNGGTRMWYIGTDNCDSDEYASGCESSLMSDPNANCECLKKATTGDSVNKCTCNGTGAITTNNCQGDTPEPYCNTRGSVVCICTKNGTLSTTGKITGGYDPGCPTDSGSMGISTALGCIPVEIKSFIPWLLQYLFGIAGGIAFLLMAYGFILIATSGGDEKKVAGAKETITSAVIGLVVCIFAIFILRLLIVNILKIPGF